VIRAGLNLLQHAGLRLFKKAKERINRSPGREVFIKGAFAI